MEKTSNNIKVIFESAKKELEKKQPSVIVCTRENAIVIISELYSSELEWKSIKIRNRIVDVDLIIDFK